jgi:fucose permease
MHHRNAAPSPFSFRLAVLTIFFVNGVGLASWVAHIPLVKARLELSEGLLGLALLGMATGALVAMPVVGWLMPRFGSRVLTTLAAILFCMLLPLPVLAPGFGYLVAALVLLGACNGALDVAMNAQAVAVEKCYRRPIMSFFHALFSLGGLVGAAVGGLALASGIAPNVHVLTAAATLTLITLLALPKLLPDAPQAAAHGHSFVRPSGPLLFLGLLTFLVLLGEGATADWGAVYLHDTLGTNAGFAALGYAAFSLTMAVGRFTGDALIASFGPVPFARASSLLAAAGLGTALLIGQPAVALIGFACVGLGLSNLIPILFSAAGRTPGMNAGTAIATVATTGYFGFLAGPALIGFTAELFTLPVALGLVVAGIALVGAFAHVARQAADGEETPPTHAQEELLLER